MVNVESCSERYAMGESDVANGGGTARILKIEIFMCERRRVNDKICEVQYAMEPMSDMWIFSKISDPLTLMHLYLRYPFLTAYL